MESRRRSAGNDPAHESPYAPPGAVDAHNSSNTVNRNNRMENPAPGSNDSGGSSTWKHKHTKMNTMPWGEACPGSLMPGSNSGEHGKSAVSGQRNGGGRDVDESNASVRGRREGYRLQVFVCARACLCVWRWLWAGGGVGLRLSVFEGRVFRNCFPVLFWFWNRVDGRCAMKSSCTAKLSSSPTSLSDL